jgi:hypothetical protein
VLAFLSVLILSVLFAVSHATAAVHAKSRSHKAASTRKVDAKRKAKKHAQKTHAVKAASSKKKKKRRDPTTTTSTTSTTTTPTQTTTVPTGTTTTPTTTTPTTTTPTPTPGPTQGTVLFNGASISSWYQNQSASTTRTQLVPDPAGLPDMAQQFTTLNTDVAPLTPTVNPRSQLVSPYSVFQPGNTYWESFEVYVPTTQTLPTRGWISLESAVYGAPFGGTPPATISINSGAFRFQRNGGGTNPFQVVWTTPVVKGQWYRFTWHFDLSANGWIELYVNDVQQPLQSGSSTVMQLPIAMLDSSDSQGPWFSQEQLYYQLGALPSAQVYFKNYQVGTTQAAAE